MEKKGMNRNFREEMQMVNKHENMFNVKGLSELFLTQVGKNKRLVISNTGENI